MTGEAGRGSGASPRIRRLDALKGAAALAVMLVHLIPVAFVATRPGFMATAAVAVQTAVYQYLCRLAVPLFFLIALYVYSNKRANNKGYLQGRIGRLGSVLVGWWFVYYVANALQAGTWRVAQLAPWMAYKHGALYFLVDLIVLTVVGEVWFRVKERVGESSYWMDVIWLSLVVGLVGFGLYRGEVSLFWSPMPFLAYIPLVSLCQLPRAPAAFGAAAILGLGVDGWLVSAGQTTVYDMTTLGYSRPSLVFLTALVFSMVLKSSEPRSQPWLGRIGAYGLGIYMVHPILIQFFPAGAYTGMYRLGDGTMYTRWGYSSAVVVATALIVGVLSISPARRWVS